MKSLLFLSLLQNLWNLVCLTFSEQDSNLKPGLHISRKDRKHLFADRFFNPIRQGGGGDDGPPKCFLTTVLKRFGGGSWNLATFDINLWSIKKSYFWFPRLSGVTIATSLSGSTLDFLKLSFDMSPNNGILKVFKSKIWLDIWNKYPKIPLNTKFQPNRWRGLGVTSIWNLGLRIV